MSANPPGTPFDEAHFGSPPEWKLPSWYEPVLLIVILFTTTFLTRGKSSITDKVKTGYDRLDASQSMAFALSTDDSLARRRMLGRARRNDTMDESASSKYPHKRRQFLGMEMCTPNTSRFANTLQSIVLQKYPFSLEIFYWVLVYSVYRYGHAAIQVLFENSNVWDVAQDRGLAILTFEEEPWLKFLWPVRELKVQRWFLDGHTTLLTTFNRAYAFTHIPSSIGFISWWYDAAPSHRSFARVRRGFVLISYSAFVVSIFFPCMPPNLLPMEYDFVDGEGRNNSQSVWARGNYVGYLASTPSIRFSHSLLVGWTLIYHAGIFRKTLQPGETRMNKIWVLFYIILGFCYPLFILVTIITTGRHYFLDASLAIVLAMVCYFSNKLLLLFLPLQDLLLWCLRLEIPTSEMETK